MLELPARSRGLDRIRTDDTGGQYWLSDQQSVPAQDRSPRDATSGHTPKTSTKFTVRRVVLFVWRRSHGSRTRGARGRTRTSPLVGVSPKGAPERATRNSWSINSIQNPKRQKPPRVCTQGGFREKREHRLSHGLTRRVEMDERCHDSRHST